MTPPSRNWNVQRRVTTPSSSRKLGRDPSSVPVSRRERASPSDHGTRARRHTPQVKRSWGGLTEEESLIEEVNLFLRREVAFQELDEIRVHPHREADPIAEARKAYLDPRSEAFGTWSRKRSTSSGATEGSVSSQENSP